MRTWITRVSIALGVALAVSAAPASGQGSIPGFVFLQDSGGQVWLTTRDAAFKMPVPIYPASDEQIVDIPTSSLWIVPKPDGSGTMAGPKPEWAASLPDAPPGLTDSQEAIKLSGERGENTKPFHLRGGNYAVTWKVQLRRDSTSCFSGATLYRVDGKRHVESLFGVTLNRDGERSAEGETQVYGVTAGQHFLDVTSPACSWSVEIRPQ